MRRKGERIEQEAEGEEIRIERRGLSYRGRLGEE